MSRGVKELNERLDQAAENAARAAEETTKARRLLDGTLQELKALEEARIEQLRRIEDAIQDLAARLDRVEAHVAADETTLKGESALAGAHVREVMTRLADVELTLLTALSHAHRATRADIDEDTPRRDEAVSW